MLTASGHARNYILDQTNVYATARKRKLRNFQGFRKICAVMQPDDAELKRREYKRTYEDGTPALYVACEKRQKGGGGAMQNTSIMLMPCYRGLASVVNTNSR